MRRAGRDRFVFAIETLAITLDDVSHFVQCVFNIIPFLVDISQSAYWDRVAGSKVFTHPLDLHLLGKYVAPDAVILDYGCGYGRLVAELRAHGYAHVQGYDTSAGLVKRGRDNGIQGLHHIDTPAAIDMAAETADAVLLFAVLTCVPNNQHQRQVIQMLHSKLRPGGILYISDYYLQDDLAEVGRYGYLDGAADNYGVFTLPEGATFRHHTREWIRDLLTQFTIEEEKEIAVMTMNGHIAKGFQMICRK